MKQSRVWAEIDLDAIAHNLRRIREIVGQDRGVMGIVKANAYGHGAVPVAWHLATLGVNAVGVGDSQEAIELRRAGLSIPILILGTVVPGELPDVVAHDIAVTVHSEERVRMLEREARRAHRVVSVHLKVDTGMGRLGCQARRAAELARLIDTSDYLGFDGLCTHFSSVGPDDDGFTASQLALFNDVTRAIREQGVSVPPRHVAASGAILSRVAPELDTVRPGIALFGLAPAPAPREDLRRALTLKTQVIFLKDFPAGTPIGYARAHVTERRTRIATLPVGYNDGYAFRLGGRADVLIRGVRAPVVGRVSMDYLTVDVGHIPGASVGDEVVLLGRFGAEEITAEELAERSGTIPYEVLTRLGKRVVRVYRGGGGPTEAGFAVVRHPRTSEIDSPRSIRQ
jgi:alanine racemase